MAKELASGRGNVVPSSKGLAQSMPAEVLCFDSGEATGAFKFQRAI